VKDSSLMAVSFIIPAHNEAEGLERCIIELQRLTPTICDKFEIIIAEDGSVDGTDVVASEITKNNCSCVIHLHSRNRLGKGKALKRAFERAKGEVLVYMDADLATDLSVLPSIIAVTRMRKGITTASRHVSGAKMERSILRTITSLCYNWLVRMLFRDGVHDHQCGCKAFHRDLIQDLLDEVKSDGWFWDTEMIVRAKIKGYPVIEIPCVWAERRKGKSKVKVFHDALYMAMSAINLYREVKALRVREANKGKPSLLGHLTIKRLGGENV